MKHHNGVTGTPGIRGEKENWVREGKRKGLNEIQINLGSKSEDSREAKAGKLNQDGSNPGLAGNLLYGLSYWLVSLIFSLDKCTGGPCMFWPQVFPLQPDDLLLSLSGCCSSHTVCLLVFLQTCSYLGDFSLALLSAKNDLPQKRVPGHFLTLHSCLSFFITHTKWQTD